MIRADGTDPGRELSAAVRARDTEAASRAARELLGQGERRILQVLGALGDAEEQRR